MNFESFLALLILTIDFTVRIIETAYLFGPDLWKRICLVMYINGLVYGHWHSLELKILISSLWSWLKYYLHQIYVYMYTLYMYILYMCICIYVYYIYVFVRPDFCKVNRVLYSWSDQLSKKYIVNQKLVFIHQPSWKSSSYRTL